MINKITFDRFISCLTENLCKYMDLMACIFDLDGVIVDTAKYHFLSWKRLADELGVEFDELVNEKLKGVSRLESLENILSRGNLKFNEAKKLSLATRKNDWFIEYLIKMSKDEILPGVSEFLDSLDRSGIKMAVGSASKNARLALDKINLIDRFDTIVDGNMVTKAKPDPEVFLLAADKLGVDPKNCIVFEDAVAGIQAAHNGSMLCVGVGKSEVLLEADYVISTFAGFNINKLLNGIRR